MARVIIFGTADCASLAHFYLRHDTEHEVVAFSVTEKYFKEPRFEGLPVIPFENIEKDFPAAEYRFFAPLTSNQGNHFRERIYREAKAKGYELISYVSSRATVFPGTVIGDNSFILEDNTLQPFVTVGSNVVLWSGNHIGHHSRIGNHVFFSSHVVLSGHCLVEPYAFLGVNSTIRDGLTIAEGSVVGMGSVVTNSTTPYGVYMGNPARLDRIANRTGERIAENRI